MGSNKRSADSPTSRLVAVKTLHPSASEEAKLDFNREIRIMNKLRHENIIQVRVSHVSLLAELKFRSLKILPAKTISNHVCHLQR